MSDPTIAPNSEAETAPPTLTPRQHQVIALLMLGESDKEIAGDLHISLHTVKKHVSAAYRRLEVRGRVEAAVRWAELYADRYLGKPAAESPNWTKEKFMSAFRALSPRRQRWLAALMNAFVTSNQETGTTPTLSDHALDSLPPETETPAPTTEVRVEGRAQP